MNLNLRIDGAGQPQLLVKEKVWVDRIEVRLFRAGDWLNESTGEITAGNWREGPEEHMYRRAYFLEGKQFLELGFRVSFDLIVITALITRDLTGIARDDSFALPGAFLPSFRFLPDLSFFLTTFGLGGKEDSYPGGYWPTAKIGHGLHELPDEAFTPLVLYDNNGALAISPGNFFLTSLLVKTAGGVGRGLHGAVDRIPAGTQLKTVITFGKDVPEALLRLGDYFISRSGKSRPEPGSHPLLSQLGWWNAYGSYYTEPVRPLNSKGLSAVIRGLQAQGIPLGYLGLDLWYPYERIGKAIRYTPDPVKYPNGIGEIAQAAGLATVLHLSALSKRNAYGADGADPAFYREVARDLVRERAIVVWHDWLRTQQYITPKLRADPAAAERWFSGMAQTFADEGLDVLLCMQTMGMNLAATQHLNVIAGRTHDDYLVSQPEAVATAARQGHPEFLDGEISVHELHRQNLLMGMVLYALGMMPFHDVFLSQAHPGWGGGHPEEEAVLRALSCGPVGIGDGPGMTDPDLIARLLLPDGSIAHPDRPPFPVMTTLNREVQVFFTKHQAGDTVWGYLVLINTGREELSFQMDPPAFSKYFFWDGLGRRLVSELKGRLPPRRIAYFVLVPQREGIGPLGGLDLFVPATHGTVKEAIWNGGWQLNVPPGGGPIAIISEQLIAAEDGGGRKLSVEKKNDIWLVETSPSSDVVHIHKI